jgi:hypothetical protein
MQHKKEQVKQTNWLDSDGYEGCGDDILSGLRGLDQQVALSTAIKGGAAMTLGGRMHANNAAQHE